jgi:hypothetical protein
MLRQSSTRYILNHVFTPLNILLATVSVVAFAQDRPKEMHPRVLMGDSSHCDALMVRNGHVSIEEVCVKNSGGRENQDGSEVAWDGHVAVITRDDEKASASWIHSHSLLSWLSTRSHNLYWDGKKVELGRVDVFDLYEAIPWQGGVLVYGRTIPRRHFWEAWPFKGDFIEARRGPLD